MITIMTSKDFFSLMFLCVTSLALVVKCQVVTPSRVPGFVMSGHPAAKVQIDFYIDPLCPDSAAAWPAVRQVSQTYTNTEVQISVQPFPLPYHPRAIAIVRAAYIINSHSNGTKGLEWLETFLLHKISKFSSRAFYDKTDADMLEDLADIMEDLQLNIPRSEFVKEIDRRKYNKWEKYSRVAWKTGASRGVYATPTFFINGVSQPQISQHFTLSQWKEVIDPLLEDDGLDFGTQGFFIENCTRCDVEHIDTTDKTTSSSSRNLCLSLLLWISLLINRVEW